MEVKPGYKRTELGIIPEDWEVTSFGKFLAFTNGVNADKVAYGTGVRFINVLEPITYSHIYGPEIPGRVEIPGPTALAYSVKVGDVVFNRTSETDTELGLAAVYLGDEHVVFGGFVIRGRPTDDTLDPTYSGYALRVPMIRSQIIPLGQGAVRANISQQNLQRVVVAIPPKPEQRAIAAALSDVDALLGGLDRLITKKRDLKQAVMQQLLTGRTRLPGFHAEWEVKRLGEIVSIRNEKVMPSNVDPETPCVELEHIGQGDGRLVAHSTARHSTSSKYRFYSGDVLFGRLRSYLRKYWLADRAGICTTEIWPLVVDPGQADSGFLLAVVQSNRFIEAASISYGTHMPRADWGVIRSFEIRLPAVREQTAIAAVLSDMDAELAALEARRNKSRALKQGMMQELLTGKTRLAISSDVVSIDFAAKPKRALFRRSAAKPHNWQINEAVVVAVLVKYFGSEQFPLGRKRCTKLAYLLHRHVEHVAQGYLKKAAGPYNPAVKYKGPEGIAQRNGYIHAYKNGNYSGFVAADNIGQAEDYFSKWYGQEVLDWLEQFRKKTNDELELLATVDMAVEDVKRVNTKLSVVAVKSVIRDHPEWEAKLEREIFSDANIALAIRRVSELFY
jgi:type I restriction enzyme, S subunit